MVTIFTTSSRTRMNNELFGRNGREKSHQYINIQHTAKEQEKETLEAEIALQQDEWKYV